jgi:hypothetical protein
MRVAWFRPSPISALDARIATAFETELSRSHTVEAFDERTAHDFVWKHFRASYDVCLYEWSHGPRHRFIGAYLFHYPGVLLAHSLVGARHALAASRLVVIGNSSAAELVMLDVPEARVRVAPQFAAPVDAPASPHLGSVVRFGVLDSDHVEVAERAMARAHAAGAVAALVEPSTFAASGRAAARPSSAGRRFAESEPPMADKDRDIDRTIRDSDVVIALQGPTFAEPLTPALLGMSAGRPVIVSEAEATADWPTLDPQTWLPRFFGNESPVAVSIDPRDEEHSLMLAIRRLSAEAPLRAQLGTAARRWWETYATPRHAAESWSRILEDAVSVPPPRPSDLPAHLTEDGTAFARNVLADFGVSVDVFDS